MAALEDICDLRVLELAVPRVVPTSHVKIDGILDSSFMHQVDEVCDAHRPA